MVGQGGKSILRASTLLTTIVGCILTVITLLTILQTAKHKKFWNDEQLEIVTLCKVPFSQVMTGKTIQANKNPLYLVLQKFLLSPIDSFNSRMLVDVRRISIAAALFTCLVSFIFIRARLGLLWAIFIIMSITSQNLFYNFAAESRPYMLWILFFSLLVMATFTMCSQSYEKNNMKNKVFFCVLALAITLVISFGVIQSGMAILTCLFCWYFIHDRPKSLNPLTHFAIPLCLVCILIQGYYTLQGVDAFAPQIMESQFDLISQIKRGDISLLKMPLRLLFPKPPRDAYLGAYLSNFFVLVGIGIPFLKWNRRQNLKNNDFFVFALSIITSVQVAATLGIALVVAFLHYWFVQRLFLYLIVCHAILATLGVYFLWSLNKNIWKPLVKGALFILFCLSLNWHWQYYTAFNRQLPEFCQTRADHLENSWRKLDATWRKMAEENSWRSSTEKYSCAHLDYIVERNQYLDDCGVSTDLSGDKVPLCYALVGEFSSDRNALLDINPFFMGGRPVYFK
ncbi:MAG: hypothetical protein HY606_15160 [Planctomycetes bacterium]|nr:hypothetical protein [Planctomycetota bacterium]